MKKIKYLFLLFLSVFAISCSAPSAGQNNNNNYQEGSPDAGNLGDNNIVTPEGHKIIYNVKYDIYVVDTITPTVRTVNNKLYELGGWVANSDESSTNAQYVYKVPADKINEFLDTVDELEGVANKQISSQDVTTSYNDLTAEIEVLEASRAAYVKMLDDDKLTLNDVITLNSKIESIDISLKKLYKNLDSLNARIDYATVTIDYRVKYVQPVEGFFDDYIDFLGDLGKFVLNFILYTAPFALVAGAGVGIVFAVKKNKRKSGK